jgi:hypothetical protein
LDVTDDQKDKLPKKFGFKLEAMEAKARKKEIEFDVPKILCLKACSSG